MTTWQQTLVPSLIFYALAGIIAMAVAAMIAGLASILGRMESRQKDGKA
ncbi:MAG TPA: hypothetical protein PKO15_18955 [Fibrobacteria bacterium]|nr:hypothetical protein [Fibrobacteria bacterium]HOX53484.1 hypothetical protein [Fibrobacteria bacterium]